MKHHGLNHVALIVRDLDKSKTFYKTLFNMREFGDIPTEALSIPLVSRGMNAQITLVKEGTPGEVRALDGTGIEAGKQGGIEHFGFVVPRATDLVTVRNSAEALGGSFFQETTIGPGIPSLFIKDPDGYLIQLTCFPRMAKLFATYLLFRTQLRALLRPTRLR